MADASGILDSARVQVVQPDPEPPGDTLRTGWQVSPSGSSDGLGTAESPWSLDFALAGAGGAVEAGDTIWLRGGTYPGAYTSSLAGTAQAPVIVRQWPGERATIDGNLLVLGHDVWIWGLEVTNTDLASADIQGVDLQAPGAKLINLIIHDASGNGIGAWAEATNVELSGNILYSNGRRGAAEGRSAHGIYAQNQSGSKVVRGNVVFQTFGYGLHFYAERSFLRDFSVDGNVLFENGMVSGCNALVGGSPPVERLTFTYNLTYQQHGDGCVWLGREGAANGPATVRGNVIVGGDPSLRLQDWAAGLTVDSNTIIRLRGNLLEQQGVLSSSTFSRNRWYGVPGSTEWLVAGDGYGFAAWRELTGQGTTDVYTTAPPTATDVYVRPDPYEPRRAVVVVYNWAASGSVAVDLSGVLEQGRPFTVHHVYRLYGEPVARGTFQGASVVIPLEPVSAPVPLAGWPELESVTAPGFFVFLVRAE